MASEGIKGLVGKRMTRDVKFMNETLKIRKLTVAEVLEIQAKARVAEQDEAEGFNVLRLVIRSSVENAEDLSDEDFNNFPLDELSKLSTEIMQYSGIGGEKGK